MEKIYNVANLIWRMVTTDIAMVASELSVAGSKSTILHQCVTNIIYAGDRQRSVSAIKVGELKLDVRRRIVSYRLIECNPATGQICMANNNSSTPGPYIYTSIDYFNEMYSTRK